MCYLGRYSGVSPKTHSPCCCAPETAQSSTRPAKPGHKSCHGVQTRTPFQKRPNNILPMHVGTMSPPLTSVSEHNSEKNKAPSDQPPFCEEKHRYHTRRAPQRRSNHPKAATTSQHDPLGPLCHGGHALVVLVRHKVNFRLYGPPQGRLCPWRLQ